MKKIILFATFSLMALGCYAQTDDSNTVSLISWEMYRSTFGEGGDHRAYMITNSSDTTRIGSIVIHGDTVSVLKAAFSDYSKLEQKYEAARDVLDMLSLHYLMKLLDIEGDNPSWNKEFRLAVERYRESIK